MGRADMRVLFAAPAHYWDGWSQALRAACPEAALHRDGDPAGFDALIYAPGYPEDGGTLDFTPFTRARVVQSLWAGVERIVTNPTLTQPLCRMVDPGLALGMRDYCLGWAMRAHLGMDAYAQDGVWRNGLVPPLATGRRVTVLGLGELGRTVALGLAALGFRVTGWSQSGRPVEGIEEVLAGPDLPRALERAEILVCLLPDTPATRNLLDARRLALLPRGATIINAGRGTLIDEDALIPALEAGDRHAVLDVFRAEPLPPGHPFWAHPRVTVTPHIAAETRPETAAPVAAENLRRAMAGAPLLHLVDRKRGY